ILVVHDADEATRTYHELLSSPTLRQELASRAHARFLGEHTYRHRARSLFNVLSETPRRG
ncbi:MAG: glycosyltransferase family 1 protein, partial [Frankiaceae bacterium]|nr:glycosyltransferase family 1 protein [Frankiaceae bacterium]